MNENEKIWYVGYGSNLLKSRFLCYIQGGQAKGCKKTDKGCNDKTLPLKNKSLIIPYEIYFAKEADIWEKSAACFLKSKKGGLTYARAYLINKNQLRDIVLQENNAFSAEADKRKRVNIENIVINFDEAVNHEESTIQPEEQFEWYARLLYLGEEEGYPLFTFTAKEDLISRSKPSQKYLKNIADGLKESHGLSNEQIKIYFEKALKR